MIDIQPYIDKLDVLKEYMEFRIGWDWQGGIPDWAIERYGYFFYFPSFEEYYKTKIEIGIVWN